MNKYENLYSYPIRLDRDSLALSFIDIEKILGFKLPPSAHKYRSWWGNDLYHVHSRSWLDAGWEVKRIVQGKIFFERIVEINQYVFSNKEKNFSIANRTIINIIFGPDFNFNNNQDRKKQLNLTALNLISSFENSLWETVIFNAWKILESIFFYIVKTDKDRTLEIMERNKFGKKIDYLKCFELIEVVYYFGFLDNETEQVARHLKIYRNVIHPDYQLTKKIKIDKNLAIIFVCSMNESLQVL